VGNDSEREKAHKLAVWIYENWKRAFKVCH